MQRFFVSKYNIIAYLSAANNSIMHNMHEYTEYYAYYCRVRKPKAALRRLRLSINLDIAQKASQSSAAHGGTESNSVISGDMRLGNDTSHAGKR